MDVKSLKQNEGNNQCAECRSVESTYVSTHLGIFLCSTCAKYHQKLGGSFNNVSNIQTHRFTDQEIDTLHCRGNIINNAEYEKHVPAFYHRPKPDDPPILYEQWMRAKYEREEFKYLSQQSAYNQGTKTGSLLKRAKDDDRFQARKFVLSEPDGQLMYFIKYSDKYPKDKIDVKEIVNVYMVPSKIKHENGMQITYLKGKESKDPRNIYVYAKEAKVASDWYHAIRAAMLRHKYKEFNSDDAIKYINTHIIREGYMTKTGPTRMEKFKRRWFVLEGSKIWYYKESLDPFPLGCIHLGSKTFGYAIKDGFTKDMKIKGHGLTISTPDRIYVLDCLSAESHRKWLAAIEMVINSLTTMWIPTKGQPSTPGQKVYDLDGTDEEERADEEDDVTVFPPKTNINGAPPTETGLYVKKNGSAASQAQNKFITGKRPPTKKEPEFTFPEQRSKIYSDDSGSDFEDNDVIVSQSEKNGEAFASPEGQPKAHPRAAKLIQDIHRERAISSNTDEDSDEEMIMIDENGHQVVINAKKHSSCLIRTRDGTKSSTDSSFESMHQSPTHTRRKASPMHKQRSPKLTAPTPKPRPLSSPNFKIDTSSSASSSSGRTTPKKPPRKKHMNSASSTGSDLDRIGVQSNESIDKNRLSASSPLTVNNCEGAATSYVNATATYVDSLQIADENQWREKTFHSIRRVQGLERKTIRREQPSLKKERSGSWSSNEEVQKRPIDITITNHVEESVWFLMFQCESDPSASDSYTTPWIGAEIAETPASVGPIRLPNDFEIAVVDTAPGHGLKRTTGPFFAEAGDVWEVDIPVDDGSAPDMYFHEGMETENGSVMVYNNVKNVKKFEVAIYKSGRKLFSRRNTRPGDAFTFSINPTLYIVAVDQDTFMDLEDEDIRVQDIIPNATPIKLTYNTKKIRIAIKKRGEVIYFQSHSPRNNFPANTATHNIKTNITSAF